MYTTINSSLPNLRRSPALVKVGSNLNAYEQYIILDSKILFYLKSNFR